MTATTATGAQVPARVERRAPTTTDEWPSGLTLFFVMLAAFVAIVGVAVYLAGQMPT